MGPFNTFQLYPLPAEAIAALRAEPSEESCVPGMVIVGGLKEDERILLTAECLQFVRDLVRAERTFSPNLEGLMANRARKQEEIYQNILEGRQAITFPAETKDIREGSWRSETDRPSNMKDRACENTHPSRAANMAIHGLNSKAASDFLDNEDSQSPLKASVVSGYHVIHGAVTGLLKDDRPNSKTILKGRISASDLLPVVGNNKELAEKTFAALQAIKVLNRHGRITDILTRDGFTLADKELPAGVEKKELEVFIRARRPATIQVRVRGLHLMEGHVLVDEKPVPGSLLDFAVFVYTCHEGLEEISAQPTLYLPKMESRLETEWWSKIFATAAGMLGINPKVIRSTTMIETITASMEKDEMNYTLRQHSLGQNKGRYDYLFNFIKRLTLPKSQQVALLKKVVETGDTSLLQQYKSFLLPDNVYTPMGTSFLEAYSNHTSQVNRSRGFDSVGGMVTNIPTGNEEVDGRARAKLRVDKTNEAWKADAGGWSGHPAFSGPVREPFDIVRGIHNGFKHLASTLGRERLEAAIKSLDGAKRDQILEPILSLAQEAKASNPVVVDVMTNALETSLTLHIAADFPKYQDGLLRFIDMSPPGPAVKDIDLIAVPAEQHTPEKFSYEGLKQYLRLALYYTASFIYGTGCIALDGVFEDLATAEKARCNVWQWLTLGAEIGLPDGTRAKVTTALFNQAMDEVWTTVTVDEVDMWNKVCKGVPPMQPDVLAEKHFVVARRILEILITNDRCMEFIPDLAYPFLLEPVRQDNALWTKLYEQLKDYVDPMDQYNEQLELLSSQLKL